MDNDTARIRAALGAHDDESTEDAARRVAGERDGARAKLDEFRAWAVGQWRKKQQEALTAQKERDAAREALLNLLRLFAGYSVDTKEVGFCTIADSDRRWIDEARNLLWPKEQSNV